MGTVETTEAPAPRRRWINLPRALERPTRTALLVALVLITVLAPDGLARAVAAGASLVLFYGAGWADGRRDMALALVRRGDDRAARQAPRPRVEPEG